MDVWVKFPGRQLVEQYSMPFNHEDWHDVLYPIKVRLSNQREEWSEHTKQGYDAPLTAVVSYDTLANYADCNMDEEKTIEILRTSTDPEIEEAIGKMQTEFNTLKPEETGYSDESKFQDELRKWMEKAQKLVNLYAAVIYHEQLRELKAPGRADQRASESESRRTVLRTWDWEENEKKSEDLRKKAAERASESKRSFSAEEKALVDRFARRINGEDSAAEREQAQARQIGPGETGDEARQSSAGAEDVQVKHDAAGSPSAEPSSIHPPSTRETNNIQGEEDNSKALEQSADPMASSPTGLNLTTPSDSASADNVQSWVDANRRTHHRGQGGKFVKGSGAGKKRKSSGR